MATKFSSRPSTLTTGDFKHYLTLDMLLFYYKEINKAGSMESEVDTFYLNFLKEIFLLKDKFGVEQEARANKALGLKTDFTIRYIKNGDPKKVILCEIKRREGESQDAVWRDALAQAVTYADLIRKEKGQRPDQVLYITVNVGTYLRFYELPGNSPQPINWAPAGGNLYELADNEEEVWTLFHQIRNLTMH